MNMEPRIEKRIIDGKEYDVKVYPAHMAEGYWGQVNTSAEGLNDEIKHFKSVRDRLISGNPNWNKYGNDPKEPYIGSSGRADSAGPGRDAEIIPE